MTAVQPPYPSEPPPPQRGLTRGTRPRRQRGAGGSGSETSKWKQFTGAMSPRFVLVDGRWLPGGAQAVHPVLPDPHLSGLGVRGAVRRSSSTLLFYITVYPMLWLTFWPVRANQKKNHPEEYAATRAKYGRRIGRSGPLQPLGRCPS